MSRFQYHRPTLRDLRLRILKYEVDDTKISDLLEDLSRSIRRSEIACEKASEGNPDILDAILDDEVAYIEELIGISLLALQTRVRRIMQASKDFKIDALDSGDDFSGTGRTLIRLIWDAANYYKHRDEWTAEVWEDTETPDRRLEQARRTRRSVQKIGIEQSSTGNMRTAYEFFGVAPYSNCRHLSEHVQAWAEGVYAECGNRQTTIRQSRP
jgi:hypothetical protein